MAAGRDQSRCRCGSEPSPVPVQMWQPSLVPVQMWQRGEPSPVPVQMWQRVPPKSRVARGRQWPLQDSRRSSPPSRAPHLQCRFAPTMTGSTAHAMLGLPSSDSCSERADWQSQLLRLSRKGKHSSVSFRSNENSEAHNDDSRDPNKDSRDDIVSRCPVLARSRDGMVSRFPVTPAAEF